MLVMPGDVFGFGLLAIPVVVELIIGCKTRPDRLAIFANSVSAFLSDDIIAETAGKYFVPSKQNICIIAVIWDVVGPIVVV